MKRQLSRAKEFYRTVRYLRQQLGWRKLWLLAQKRHLTTKIAAFDMSKPAETILVISPHPDDEAFGCGGALSFHAKHNDKIHILYLHAGDGGDTSKSADTSLAAKRIQEAKSAATSIHAEAKFWNIADGKPTNSAENVAKLIKLIEEIQPVKIYTPWINDNHADHIDASALLANALLKLPDQPEIWQYEIWSPLVPNYFLPIGAVISDKLALMAKHESQLKNTGYKDGIIGLNHYRGLQAGVQGAAEAYFVSSKEAFLEIAV